MKRLLAIAMGAGMLSMGVAGVANAAPSPQQCTQMHSEAAAGKTLSFADKLYQPGNANSLQGNTLKIYSDNDRIRDIVKAAGNQWEEASQGKINIDLVDQDGPDVVKVNIYPMSTAFGGLKYAEAWAGNVGKANPEIKVKTFFVSKDKDFTSAVWTMAHEIGHHLGLIHGCDNSLMAGSGPAMTRTPSTLDVAAVLQLMGKQDRVNELAVSAQAEDQPAGQPSRPTESITSPQNFSKSSLSATWL